jgi:hypothetical protein
MINSMPPVKQKTKTKELSFEHYARAIQTDIAQLGRQVAEGFKSIREEMATKEDLFNLGQKMVTREEFRELRSDVKMITDSMVSKADLSETIRRELDASPYAKESEVKHLSERMLRVEEAVGIKPKRRTA